MKYPSHLNSRLLHRLGATAILLLFSHLGLANSLPEGLTTSDWSKIRAAHRAHQRSDSATADPVAQQAYLQASNANFDDRFGVSVAISGDTVVVGANGEDSKATGVNGNETDNSAPFAGAAYVFVRQGETWTQQAYLKASNTETMDQFGWWVAISGDTVVVGAPGEDSDANGVNGNQGDNNAEGSGAAYVFVRNGTTWSQQAYLKASNSDLLDTFGNSVAISGDTVVVGANWEASSTTGVNGDQADNGAAQAGAAYVFVRTGTTWSQQAYLKASNTDAGDWFGNSVAISGGTVLVGAPFEASNAKGINGNQNDNSASQAGAAYIFVRNGTSWSQQAYLKASNTDPGDFFGFSVALSGDTGVIGAYQEASNATGVNGDQSDNSNKGRGAAYVFVRNGIAWTQQAYLKASNTPFSGFFGYSVAVSSDTILIGATLEGSNATGVDGDQNNGLAPNAGAAYAFARNGANWSQQAYLKASNTQISDYFGYSVAVDGDTGVVGSYLNPAQSTETGSAYVFNGLGGTPPTIPLLNISTRMNVGTDDNVLIGGFIVVGTEAKKVLLRAIGPSLSDFGILNALPDPIIELHKPDMSVVTNDNWRDTQEQEIIDTTIPPTNDLESAIVATLDPGPYTAIVRGKNNTTGVGLVEVYDLDQAADSQLANISTRGFVETDDNVMIGGFIVGDGISTTVVIRALGPSLGGMNVADPLQDPTLELHDTNGVLVDSNDDWKETQEAEIEAAGLAPTDDRESAIEAVLAPGLYTAIVRGKNNTTGVGLMEVYNLL